jgi:3-dehydroquinate synthetase
MGKDKKKRAGAVRFVLQRGWGDTFQEEVPEKILRQVLS